MSVLGVLPSGQSAYGDLPSKGGSASGRVCLEGGLPLGGLTNGSLPGGEAAHPPPNRQTYVKTLPSLAVGKNIYKYFN